MNETIQEAKTTWSGPRRLSFFIVAAAYGVLLVSPLSLLSYAVIGWILTGEGTSHRVHEISFGVVFVLSLLGLLAQFRSTSRKVAPMQQVAVPILVLILVESLVTGVGPDTLPLFLMFGVPPVVLAVLHPSRREVFKPTVHPSRNLLVLVIALAIPLVIFAVNQIRTGLEARTLAAPVFQQIDLPETATEEEFFAEFERIVNEMGIDDEQRELIEHSGHWSGMAGWALGLVVLALLVAMRVIGFRFTAWSVGGAVAYYGIASVATPEDASSGGLIGGLSVIAWGIAFVILTEMERVRNKDQGPRINA
ncbi:MAG: hypothetical protein ACRDWH_04855 [Acidimicrobiia bacterium]